MLHAEHARGERVRVVVAEHRHRPLGDDRSAVVFLIDEVYRNTRHRDTGREHCLVDAPAVHAGTAERGQERWMDVDEASCITMNDVLRHAPQIAGEDEEVNGMLREKLSQVRGGGASSGDRDVLCRNATGAGALERTRGCAIAYDHDDVAAPASAELVEVIEDRL